MENESIGLIAFVAFLIKRSIKTILPTNLPLQLDRVHKEQGSWNSGLNHKSLEGAALSVIVHKLTN